MACAWAGVATEDHVLRQPGQLREGVVQHPGVIGRQ